MEDEERAAQDNANMDEFAALLAKVVTWEEVRNIDQSQDVAREELRGMGFDYFMRALKALREMKKTTSDDTE